MWNKQGLCWTSVVAVKAMSSYNDLRYQGQQNLHQSDHMLREPIPSEALFIFGSNMTSTVGAF
jgi:hypothetical protein